MRHLTKEQFRAPKRETESLQIPEFSAPLLLAKPSASLAIRMREGKVNFGSEEAISATIADMVVDENGERVFAPESVSAFLEGISADSLKVLVTKCFEMYGQKAATPDPSKPSTSA